MYKQKYTLLVIAPSKNTTIRRVCEIARSNERISDTHPLCLSPPSPV